MDAPFEWQPKLGIEKPAHRRIVKPEFDRMKDEQKARVRSGAGRSEGRRREPAAGGTAEVRLPAACGSFFRRKRRLPSTTLPGRAASISSRGKAPAIGPTSSGHRSTIPAVEYIRAQRARTLLMREMDRFMADWDVLVSPSFSAGLTITNLTGHPQVAAPCGFNKDLPASIVFTGHLYQEGTPMRVALAFERATKWHTMHPKVDWS